MTIRRGITWAAWLGALVWTHWLAWLTWHGAPPGQATAAALLMIAWALTGIILAVSS